MVYFKKEVDQDDSAWYPIPNHPNHEVSLRGHVRHKKKNTSCFKTDSG